MRVKPIPHYVYNEMVMLFSDCETEVLAGRGDITCIAGKSLACLCQRKNEANNLIVFSVGDNSIANVRAMCAFILFLKERHGIEHVRIEGRRGRYALMRRIFPTVRIDPMETERDVRYLYVDADCARRLSMLADGASEAEVRSACGVR